MHPGAPPRDLPQLSPVEESLIALHCPVLKIVRLKGGQLGYSGNCVAVTQDLGPFVSKLPRHIEDTHLTIVVPFCDATDEAPKSLRVSSLKIRRWLMFLIEHNPLYAGISIDENALTALPSNGNDFQHLLPLICIAADDDPVVAAADGDINVQGIMGDTGEHPEQVLVDNLIWPERSTDAIREFHHPNILAKCFPTVFPWGIGDPTSPTRQQVVTLAEGICHLEKYAYYSESEARIIWPFGEHPVAPFYAFDVKTRQSLLGQSGIFLKQASLDFPKTIEDLREQMQDPASKSKILKQIGRYAGNLPGTPGFWQSRKDELLSLCEQSTPHIWFTLSAADNFWWDLRKILPAGAKPSSFPHLVDGYVAMRMDSYVKQIWGSRAEWTWYRLEYQSRGTVHLHGCIRLRDLPELHALYAVAVKGRTHLESPDYVSAGIAAEQTICDIADTLCCAWNPSPPADAHSEIRDELGERPVPHPCSMYFDDPSLEKLRLQQTLNEVQRHRHNDSYCIRKGVCRFGYPLPLVSVTQFIWTKTASGDLKGTLMYRRNDRWLNNYDCGFKCWNANMDVKLIYNMHCLAEYLCGYATKSEVTSPSVARTLSLAVTNPRLNDVINPVQSAIRSAFIKGHSGRNISAQETAHLNLSLPLVCQPSIEYVRLSLDNSKSHQLDLDAQGDSMIVPNLFELYRARLNSGIWIEAMHEWCATPECLQMSLQTFSVTFYYCKKIAKLAKRAVTCNMRIIIAYPKLRADPNSRLYPKYCFHKLLLHHPWNDEHGWSESNSVELWEAYSANTGLNSFDDVLLNIVPDENVDPVFSPEADQSGFAHWNLTMDTREAGLHFRNTVWTQNLQYDPNILTSMEDARKSACDYLQVDIGTNVVLDQHQQRIVDEFCGPTSGLCLMTGSGGFGKSEVSLAIKRKLGSAVAVTAMTGKAGSLINGTTLHAFAHLPIKKQHKCALSPVVLGRFQKSLESITHLIVDEFTMMSQEVLYFLDLRMREGKASGVPFGGMNILLVGDIAQLPPVQGLCLWARPTKSSAFETTGAALYQLFNTVYTLKINYRQRSAAGAQLATFLEGMRNGALTVADYHFLLSRSRETVGEVAWAAAVSTAIHLYPTNEMVSITL